MGEKTLEAGEEDFHWWASVFPPTKASLGSCAVSSPSAQICGSAGALVKGARPGGGSGSDSPKCPAGSCGKPKGPDQRPTAPPAGQALF